jgi:hypothetical protein
MYGWWMVVFNQLKRWIWAGAERIAKIAGIAKSDDFKTTIPIISASHASLRTCFGEIAFPDRDHPHRSAVDIRFWFFNCQFWQFRRFWQF